MHMISCPPGQHNSPSTPNFHQTPPHHFYSICIIIAMADALNKWNHAEFVPLPARERERERYPRGSRISSPCIKWGA
ncbi:hypothetical protein DAI22_09g098500 [Oryza sativa Japonica Group]|nr:hypothetical protein DAI22_09g098500 [Oryza sativa Japonica Group]